jgi:hypothetical protein
MRNYNANQHSKRLQEAGLDERIADIHAEQLSEIVTNNLATKSDLANMKEYINGIKKEIELTMRLGGLMIGCTTILSILLMYLKK